MSVGLTLDEGVAVLTCSGELDGAQSRLVELVEQACDAGARRIVVDLLDVSFVDSSVVRALIIAVRCTSGAGGWVRVVYDRPIIGKVLRICGLSDLLPRYPTVAEALAAPASPDAQAGRS